GRLQGDILGEGAGGNEGVVDRPRLTARPLPERREPGAQSTLTLALLRRNPNELRPARPRALQSGVWHRRSPLLKLENDLGAKPLGRTATRSSPWRPRSWTISHQDGFRDPRRQMVEKGRDRGEESLSVGDERGDRGVAGDPVRQPPPQRAGFDRRAADVTRQ